MAETEQVITQAVEVLEKSLDEMALQLYSVSERTFRPMFPWVFVRVLKREQQVGSVVVPDIDQNKPIHEGIVLATWQPFTEERGKVDEHGRKFTRTIERRSELTPGDHVLFPHWAGQPIQGFNDKNYRVIRETDFSLGEQGGILATVHYDEKRNSVYAKLQLMLRESLVNYADIDQGEGTIAVLLAAKIEDRFLLVDREGSSVTLSGR